MIYWAEQGKTQVLQFPTTKLYFIFINFQIKSADSGKVLASKHTLVTVVPRHNTQTSTLQTRGHLSEDLLDPSKPTLGPVVENIVFTTRGKDVTLECREGDGKWVYWRKQGDPKIKHVGPTLRLFRVDRWDSGQYYCTTNTTLSSSVTLEVKQAPNVTAVSYREIPKQKVGHKAVLRCKVEASPVPQVTWFHLENRNETTSNPMISQKRRIHSGENYGITVTNFRDGSMESILTIPSVRQGDYGQYICFAKNELGEDEVFIPLEESPHPSDFEDLYAKEEPRSSSSTSSVFSKTNQNQRISSYLAFVFIMAFLTN